ncbi:glycosyl transferase [Planotetraspora silvatica]|uniref:Glycosyl transferase n=1 Tax=Planotetraspora silvatica TaxID=234614 RepID=A0A8J3UJ77_9ACTN|nr:glycosyltransferase [Planotetraspora silvatica]GII44727.1 glycosyl transferase [Planotetraspora silvatica]
MRVLHVNKFLYRRGGAEAYMLDLAEMQVKGGNEVAFFAMRHPDNITSEYEGHFPRHLEMNPMPKNPIAMARGAGRMLWSTSARRGMARVIEEFAPDVAHLHNVYHQLSPSVVAALRDAGVPVVMTLHDYKLACPTYSFIDHGKVCTACVDGDLREAVRRRCKDDSLGASAMLAAETWLHRRYGAYDGVNVFISPSKFLAGQLTRAGVYPDRLRVLSNFADPSGVTPKSQPGGPLVCVGRLHETKGVDTAIRAMGLLGSASRLVVAGDGPERANLERLAEQVAPGRVRFLGRISRQEVLDLLISATALLVPSRWYENQPMTILEAYSCGVPVIGTSLGGVSELVIDGATGRLIPPDEPMELASAALALLRDPERSLAMGKSARAMASSRYSPESHLRAIGEIYAEARRLREIQTT